MKQLGIAMLLALGLVLGACGAGSNNSGNINGNWTAMLTDTNGNQDFAFTTSLTQTSGTSVSVTNLSFTTQTTTCFASGQTATGTFALTGNFNGNLTGTYAMTITSGTPSGNVLTLQGNVANSTVSGTWTLTGVGCSGNGNFTMTKM